MKVNIYLVVDEDWNSLNLPTTNVKDEEEIIQIAKQAWTEDQIERGSVCYDNLNTGHMCIPVNID